MYENKILELVKKENPSNPMMFVQNIVKEYSLEKMNEAIQGCSECSISNCMKTKGCGNPNASIMVIGEFPTKELQDSKNVDTAFPFFFEQENCVIDFLKSENVSTDSIYVMNTVQCYPIDSSGRLRVPTIQEKRNCSTFIDYAINTVMPLMIISVGGVPTRHLSEEIGSKNIMNVRGNMFMYRGIPVMPTCHTNILNSFDSGDVLRGQYLNYIKQDISLAIKAFRENYPNVKI